MISKLRSLCECRLLVVCPLLALAVLTFVSWTMAFNLLSPWYGGGWMDVVAASSWVFVVVLSLSFIVHCLTGASSPKWRWMTVMGLVFLAALAVIRVLDGIPGWHMISDYAAAQGCLESNRMMIGHPLFAEYWCAYELLISFLGIVFKPTLLTGQVLNAFLLAAAVYPVYKTAERMAGAFTAIFVSLLMGLSPGLLFYSSFLSGEFAGAVGLLYAFWFFDLAMTGDLSGRQAFACALCAGIALGCAHAMKPLAMLFLGAALCNAAAGVIAVRCKIRRVAVVTGLFVLMLVSYKVTFGGIRAVVEDVAGQSVPKLSAVPWGGLGVGLNLPSGGCWAADISGKVHSEPISEVKRFVIERAKREYPEYPKLFMHKFAVLHSPNGWQSFWYGQNTGRSPSPLFCRCRDNWFACECLLGLLGVFGILLSMTRGWQFLSPAAFSMLVIGGFTLAILVLEVQERYRTSIYPFYFLIMPYAIAWIGRSRVAGWLTCWRERHVR